LIYIISYISHTIVTIYFVIYLVPVKSVPFLSSFLNILMASDDNMPFHLSRNPVNNF